LAGALAQAAAVSGLIEQAGRCRTTGDLQAAEALLRQAVQQAPSSAAALTNHGLLLSELGRNEEAVALQQRAVALVPGMAAAWTNLALALRQWGDDAGADQAQAQARSLDPHSPQAWVAAGMSAQAGGQLGQAIDAYRAAVRTDSNLPEAWINLALALHETGDTTACQQALDQALKLRPTDRRALSNLLMTSQYQPALTATDLQAVAARAAPAWPSAGPRPAPRKPPRGRLRVGYLSGDLYAHPVGWLLAPVLRAHDRHAIEVHVFDHRPAQGTTDAVTQALRDATEHWHNASGLDDTPLARCIAQAGIDVLVDLAGHTQRGRLGVLAQRPAPVQLSWLGYFGSTGVPSVDAVVLGDDVAPPGAEAAYTEVIERVAGIHFAYEPPAWAPAPTAPPCGTAGIVTFGSFNNPAKMGDAVVQLWAQVLRRVPGSRLVLKWKSYGDPVFADHTRQRFAAHGIAAERIQPRPASAHAQMLAEYGDIDVALDPFPFNGLTTTLEALWMGVPVVTLPLQRTVSRQTLAVLQSLGLQRWAQTTPKAYADCAAALAADLPTRTALRHLGPGSLRQRMAASPLMNAAGLARALESIFQRRLDAVHTTCPD
jgi:protein O-GlcNAc transferase